MRFWLFIAGVNGAVAVALDAVAAHALMGATPAVAMVQTAARYQLVHAVALLAVAVLMLHGRGSRRLKAAAWLFLAGIVLFCGSLYAGAFGLAGTALAPLGGASFIAGWIALAAAAFRGRP